MSPNLTPSSLSLRQLEVFHAVVSAGGITSAAERLGVSQPTISTMIRRMEDQLGLALVQKQSGRLVPTNEGRILHEAIERNFHHFKSIADSIAFIQRDVSQRMSIATIQPLGVSLVPLGVKGFLASNGFAKVHQLNRQRRAVYHAVAAEGADIGVSFGTGDAEVDGLKVERLCEGRLYCILPKGHPLEAKDTIDNSDMQEWPQVSFRPETQWLYKQYEKIAGKRQTEPTLSVENVLSVYPYVENGVGIGLVDEFSLRAHSKERISFRPFTPNIEIIVELVYPQRRLSELTKDFVAYFKTFCADLSKSPL